MKTSTSIDDKEEINYDTEESMTLFGTTKRVINSSEEEEDDDYEEKRKEGKIHNHKEGYINVWTAEELAELFEMEWCIRLLANKNFLDNIPRANSLKE